MRGERSPHFVQGRLFDYVRYADSAQDDNTPYRTLTA